MKGQAQNKETSHVKHREFERLSLSLRIQHMALFTSVLFLIVTGLPLKFAHTGFSQLFFKIVGGVMVSGVIHRVAAVVLIGVGVYHMFYISLTSEGRKFFRDLLPTLKDFKDVGQNVLYFFGFAREGARFGRFSYIEKFDYWAVYWGMVIMIGSGLMLWFHEHVLQVVPKLWLDIAREAHSDEALLATLAIFIWHFYNVHLNPSRFPMSMTWWTGKISEEEMIREHPLEYEKLMAEQSGADSWSARDQGVPEIELPKGEITGQTRDAVCETDAGNLASDNEGGGS